MDRRVPTTTLRGTFFQSHSRTWQPGARESSWRDLLSSTVLSKSDIILSMSSEEWAGGGGRGTAFACTTARCAEAFSRCMTSWGRAPCTDNGGNHAGQMPANCSSYQCWLTFLYAQVSSSTQRRPSLELDLCARFPPTLPSRTLPRLTQCFEQEIDAARGESAIVTDLQDELQAAWRPSIWSFHSADCCCGSPKARCQELVVGSRCAPCPPVVVVPTAWDDSRGALGWPRQGGDDKHSSSSWSMWELQRRRCSAQATALDPFPQVTGFGMWAQHTCVNVCAASKRNKFETSRWRARATDTQERSLGQVSI